MSEQVTVNYFGILFDRKLEEEEVELLQDTFIDKVRVEVNGDGDAIFLYMQKGENYVYYDDKDLSMKLIEGEMSEEEGQAIPKPSSGTVATSNGVASWYNGVDSPFYDIGESWEGWNFG